MASPLGPNNVTDWQNPRLRKIVQTPDRDVLTRRTIAEPTRQLNWPNPNPRKPHAWIHTFAGSLLALGLLVSVPPKPFIQTAQANPVTKKATLPPDVGQNNTLRKTVFPFSQEDWVTPPAKRRAQPDVVENNTLYQRPPPPLKQTQWPNPVLKKPPVQSWQDTLRSLELPFPFNESDWATPPAKRRAQPDVVENNTLYQVIPPSAAPFVQEDWTTPPAKRRAQPDVVENNTLYQVPPPPLKQTNWPNPVIKKPPTPTWDDELRQINFAAPFYQTNWPVSPPKRYAQPDVVENNTLYQVIPPSAAPFNETEWVTPPAKRRAQPDVVENNTLYQVPPPVAGFPFRQTNWPNPVLKKPPVQSWQDTLRQLDLPLPFSESDWVTPPAKRHAQPDVVQNNLLKQAVVIAGKPFSQTDWPNPALKKPPVQSWQDTLRPLELPLPFGEADQPNPVVRRAARQELIENNTLYQVPPPVAGFPFRQTNWPNPVLKKPPTPTWDDELRQINFAAPFVQEDWQNPVVRRAARQELIENNTLYQAAPPVAGFPFRQTQWLNPALKKPPVPSWEDSLRQLNLAAPFVQEDWQNPVVRRAARQELIENNTLYQVAPVAPAPFRQTDWQNPRPKKAPSQSMEDSLRQLNLAAPFVQEDWTTPPAKRRAQPDVVQNTTIRQVAPVVVTLPFGQEDWTNPQRRKPSQQEFVQNTLVYKPVIPAVLPFRQLDWQNPTLRKAAQQPAPYQRSIVATLVPVTGVTGFGTIGTVTVVIVNLWNPVDDNQGSVWGAVPDAQTPSWTPVVDGQVGSWSPVSDTQTPSWASVDDTQTTSWTSVNDAQTPAWGTINDAQTPTWVPVNDAQTPAWSAVADTQIVVWTNVNDTQVNAWTPVDDSQNDDWTPVPP